MYMVACLGTPGSRPSNDRTCLHSPIPIWHLGQKQTPDLALRIGDCTLQPYIAFKEIKHDVEYTAWTHIWTIYKKKCDHTKCIHTALTNIVNSVIRPYAKHT